jgi:hypothetical protein
VRETWNDNPIFLLTGQHIFIPKNAYLKIILLKLWGFFKLQNNYKVTAQQRLAIDVDLAWKNWNQLGGMLTVYDLQSYWPRQCPPSWVSTIFHPAN